MALTRYRARARLPRPPVRSTGTEHSWSARLRGVVILVPRGLANEDDQRAGYFSGPVRWRQGSVPWTWRNLPLGRGSGLQRRADSFLGRSLLGPAAGRREPRLLRRNSRDSSREQRRADGTLHPPARPVGRGAPRVRRDV